LGAADVAEWESGRIEARIGLRMMPTFPRSPRLMECDKHGDDER
jgi:hypothetical protein